jgi:hypothetical protein
MQCLGYLADDVHCAGRIKRTVGQHRVQVAALDQPHIDVEAAVDFAVVMDRYHVRAVQSCGRMGFPAEASLKLVVLRQIRR